MPNRRHVLSWSDRETEVDPDNIDDVARAVYCALNDGGGDWAVPNGLDERVHSALVGARGASEGQIRMVLEAIGKPWTLA